jgi:uncharacterized membrane protein
MALAVFGAGAQGAGAEPTLSEHSAVMSPGAKAASAPHSNHVQSQSVSAGSTGVNGAATGTYATQAYRGGGYQGASVAGFWGVGTTFGCFALSPIVAGALVNANEHRQLTSREVHVMLADCTIPFIGGWLMGRYWDGLEARQRAQGHAQHASAGRAHKRSALRRLSPGLV